MDTRVATILASEDLGEAGTKIIDINLKDIISRIVIKFRAINGSDGISAHPAANLSKIEVVDGSDVLFSLSGHQAQAVNFFDRGKVPFSGIFTWSGAGCEVFCGIDFGRFLHDPILALDPNKFRNPQLKITFDENVCNTDCTENYCEVLANIFDEKVPTPTGFFMTKDIYSYIIATSGYEYIDLPTDHVMQQIFVKCLLAGYDFTGEIDEFRLSEDNDKRVPLDITSGILSNQVFEEYGFVEEHAKLAAGAGVITFYGMPNTNAHALGSAEGAAELLSVWSNGGGSYGSQNTGATMRARVKTIGILPHGVIPLLPKPGPEIADWYDVAKLGSLKLRIKDGATAADTATGEVIIKQYRPYAAK